MARQRIGGSFAPPLTTTDLDSIEGLANTTETRVQKAMLRLVLMLRTFWETGESTREGTPHPVGVGTIVPLKDGEVQRIWDLVPWKDEATRLKHGEIGDDDCDQYSQLFATLKGEVRSAAFHLLWYARELALDREPMTADKLS